MPVITDKVISVFPRQPSFQFAPQVCRDTLLIRKFGETIVAKALHSFFDYVRESLNKSSAAGQWIFCPQSAVRKTGNTYSIPTFSVHCPETKSLAASSCRLNQSFPGLSQTVRYSVMSLACFTPYILRLCSRVLILYRPAEKTFFKSPGIRLT